MPRTLVLGHRGSPLEAPENTLRSFRLALAAGADGVELDVRPSADGVAVVVHDETLERTTDGRGPVAALPWARIAAARAGGEPVPRLEAVCAWAAETGAWLNVEVKAPGVEEEVARAVREAGIGDRVLLSSFLPGVVADLGRRAPELPRFLLTERWDAEAARTAGGLGVRGVCLGDAAATDGALADVRARGWEAVVWTVDDPARLRALVEAEVRAVITNRPARGVAARAAAEGDDAAPGASLARRPPPRPEPRPRRP